MSTIYAPWSPAEVAGLTRWQQSNYFHPYTCPVCRDSSEYVDVEYELRATLDGWVCDTCDYTQDWAHEMSVLSQEDLHSINKMYGSFFGENEEKGDLSYLFAEGTINPNEPVSSTDELRVAWSKLLRELVNAFRAFPPIKWLERKLYK